MTTPRIQSNNSTTTTDSLDASYPKPSECVGEPNVEAVSGRQDQLAGVYDATEQLHQAAEQGKSIFESAQDKVDTVVGAMKDCMESPADDVRNLKKGESAVGKVGFDLEFTAGVGGSAASSAAYTVARDENDNYKGTFTGAFEFGGKLGSSVDNKGASAGVATGHAVKIEVEGDGPAAAEEFARLVESRPHTIPEAIADSDAVHLKAVVWDTDVSAVGSVGAGLKSTVTLVKGVERDRSGELQPMVGFAVSSSGRIDTPTLDPNNDEIATDIITNSSPMMKMLPRELSEEIVRFNGGVVGINAAVEARVEVRQTGTMDSGVTTIQGNFKASYNNRALQAKVSATLDASDLSSGEIEQALKDGDFAKAQHLAAEVGVEFEVDVRSTEFEGCSATGPFEYQKGVERSEQAWKYNRRLN